MQWFRRDIRKNAFLAAPAVALALAACGGASDVSSDAASAPTAVTETETSAPVETTEPATSDTPTSDADAGETAEASTEAAAPAASAPVIERLSADEAIANAEVNLANLQSADSVLDIETLAVADGSIQTLRDVVVGDKPVLLWFFSPH